jgi:DNA-3-methyladenine glycosylase II
MPSPLLRSETDLKKALAQLLKRDPRLTALVEKAGPPPLRRRSAGFVGLASIVVSQQLSTASAAAIWSRFSAAFEPFDHRRIRRARTIQLQRIGLSAPKIRTIRALAHALERGQIDLDALAAMPPEDAHATLTALHGIGPWTADLYLLFCLGHADAWPAGDLALQESMRLAFNLPTRPSVQEMIALAEGWRPWRGVAAKLLWAYYRAVKGREGAPVQSPKPQSAKRAIKNGRA